jgi:hypothetical protein
VSIAGKIKQISREQDRAVLHLEGPDGEPGVSAGQSRMFIPGIGADLLKPGATIWGGASGVEIQNPGEAARHMFKREGYTTLVFEETKAS